MRIIVAQPPLGVSFLLILAISSVALAFNTLLNSFSLQQVHWAFIYLFFYVAAVIQHDANRLSWGLSKFGSGNFFLANVVVLAWSLAWLVGSNLSIKTRNATAATTVNSNEFRAVPVWLTILLFAGSVGLNLAKLQSEGVYGFLFRGAGTTFEASGSSSLALTVFTAQKVLPLALVLAALWNLRLRPTFGTRLTVAFTLAFCLLANFPTATPRFWAATLIIGFLAHFGILARRGVLVTMLLAGVLFIFPVLGQIRRIQGLGGGLTITREPVTDSLSAGDFDAYSMIVWGLDFIGTSGYSFGRNFLSAGLFFVPRSVWEGKSLGTGRTIADAENLTFNNVSAPLPLESYWAAGLVGVIVVGLAVGRVTQLMDEAGHSGTSQSFGATFAYPFGLGLLFFIMRGDLLSSVSYGTALVGSILLISFTTRPSKPRLGPRTSRARGRAQVNR